LEYLNGRGWTISETFAVPVEHTPVYERLGPPVAELADRGASLNTIASALDTQWHFAKAALVFARSGVCSKSKPPGRWTGTGGGTPKYVALAEEVVRLKEQERMSFQAIASLLGVSAPTATRAYDHARRDAGTHAAEQGRSPTRGHFSHLSSEVRRCMLEGLSSGLSVHQVAREAGCSPSTVYRIRQSHVAD
jgi:transposase-like protein